jgi:hypothetical protein
LEECADAVIPLESDIVGNDSDRMCCEKIVIFRVCKTGGYNAFAQSAI